MCIYLHLYIYFINEICSDFDIEIASFIRPQKTVIPHFYRHESDTGSTRRHDHPTIYGNLKEIYTRYNQKSQMKSPQPREQNTESNKNSTRSAVHLVKSEIVTSNKNSTRPAVHLLKSEIITS
jgi:hypothetical protein